MGAQRMSEPPKAPKASAEMRNPPQAPRASQGHGHPLLNPPPQGPLTCSLSSSSRAAGVAEVEAEVAGGVDDDSSISL